MNTQTNPGLSFNYDEPTDKPMMKALLKLRNMGLIEVEWVPGDIRYTSETPFSVKKHLNVRVTDPTVELDFPKVNEPLDWTDYDKTRFILISVVYGLETGTSSRHVALRIIGQTYALAVCSKVSGVISNIILLMWILIQFALSVVKNV